jgi:hypothetical protein
VVDHRLADTFEAAAMEAIHVFCDQHPKDIAGHPIGLFPAMDSRDPEWTFRVTYCDHLLGSLAGKTLRATVRFMNAQYRYQTLQQHDIYRLTNIAQGYHNQVGRQNTQIKELQATVTAKEEIITQREETIQHQEDQIVESDALVVQRELSLTFSRSKFMSSTLILAKLLTISTCFMNNQGSPLLMSLRVKQKNRNLKKLKESPRSTLSMEILFLVPIIPLLAVSHPWATSMTFSLV